MLSVTSTKVRWIGSPVGFYSCNGGAVVLFFVSECKNYLCQPHIIAAKQLFSNKPINRGWAVALSPRYFDLQLPECVLWKAINFTQKDGEIQIFHYRAQRVRRKHLHLETSQACTHGKTTSRKYAVEKVLGPIWTSPIKSIVAGGGKGVSAHWKAEGRLDWPNGAVAKTSSAELRKPPFWTTAPRMLDYPFLGSVDQKGGRFSNTCHLF